MSEYLHVVLTENMGFRKKIIELRTNLPDQLHLAHQTAIREVLEKLHWVKLGQSPAQTLENCERAVREMLGTKPKEPSDEFYC